MSVQSGRRHLVPTLTVFGTILNSSIILLVLVGCGNPQPTNEPIEITGPTMGTQYSVKLAQLPRSVDLEQLQAEIDRTLETINDQMSTYRPKSELSRFNDQQQTEWFAVSADTVLVVAEALRVSRLSKGAFDVTVAPLVNLWSFGPEPRPQRIPADAEIAEAIKKVGYQKIEVRKTPPALRKQQREMRLDLSAIAKGFGVDRVAQYLDSRGVRGYLVDIGGEVRTCGTKADGSAWRLGIETPLFEKRTVYKNIVVELVDLAMASSGDYRNYFQVDGKRYSHTIDPRTGRPIEHRLASVSVVAENCMLADAMATTLMVLGPEAGYNFAIEHDLAAFLIIRKDDGFVEKVTPAFEELLANKRGPQ